SSYFFSSRRRYTSCYRDWSSDVCSSDLHGRTPSWCSEPFIDDRDEGGKPGRPSKRGWPSLSISIVRGTPAWLVRRWRSSPLTMETQRRRADTWRDCARRLRGEVSSRQGRHMCTTADTTAVLSD